MKFTGGWAPWAFTAAALGAVAVYIAIDMQREGSANFERRIDKLEQDNARMRDEMRRLSTNDDAFLKMNETMFGDVAERFFRAAITDEHNKNIPRWWCINASGLCLRTLVECEAKLVEARRKRPDDKRLVDAVCAAQRVAYCDQTRWCVGSLATCESIKGNSCIGGE